MCPFVLATLHLSPQWPGYIQAQDTLQPVNRDHSNDTLGRRERMTSRIAFIFHINITYDWGVNMGQPRPNQVLVLDSRPGAIAN